MAQVSIADCVIPEQFTDYIVENSMVSTALFKSGVAVGNGEMKSQLQAGAQFFTVPIWSDLADVEADITSDNIAVLSTPQKITAAPQKVRKSFLHASWSEMNLASELSGSDALQRIQSRVQAYWDRQYEKRLIASLLGVLYSNTANNASDMILDISGETGTAANFSASAVITAAATLGDRLEDVKAIAMHSAVYSEALQNNLIQFIPQSQGLPFKTFRGMAVVLDDNLVTSTPGVYLTVLMGYAAIGFAVTPPRTGYGTEIWRIPDAGNGGGNTTLHSRVNLGLHPLGFSFTGASVAGESPTMAELAMPANWTRAFSQRKSIPLAFLVSK